MSDQRLSGRCLCGAVTFTATPKGGMHACHCETCRRWSGGVYLSVACETVEVANPEAVAVFDSSEWADRRFCRSCGSTLFWTLKGGGLTAVSVQAFDDPSAFAFEDEIFIEAKPSNYDFAGDRPRRTGAEVMAQFGGED
ncbi:GFA family protein [Brevundimonas sp. Root1279]|uniref:GFA family protein n=1 Tax=Brevundimonas sp. Root1279 TaxID=1736443 RepID=UPI0006FEB22C|nr:GFA family protein [Brevundimonas sp. Root1279]KQW83605.1 hypothetical protein ASC65_02810 [Brevundimonas sp. Root1279]